MGSLFADGSTLSSLGFTSSLELEVAADFLLSFLFCRGSLDQKWVKISLVPTVIIANNLTFSFEIDAFHCSRYHLLFWAMPPPELSH